MFLVEEGCSIEEVDQVSEDFGFPMGRFKVFDLSGTLNALFEFIIFN